MRILTQTISQGTIEVAGRPFASSGCGLALFVGFTNGDDTHVAMRMAHKVVEMRLLPDAAGKTNLSIGATNGTLLVIPNFTLYGSLVGGRRPSFSAALAPSVALGLFNEFVEMLQKLHPQVTSGAFGAEMKITLVNEGPFSLILDSDELCGAQP